MGTADVRTAWCSRVRTPFVEREPACVGGGFVKSFTSKDQETVEYAGRTRESSTPR